MDSRFWARVEEARARWDVLAHPFYVRWSAGTLTRAELAGYAGQYEHLVRALAEASRHAAEALPGDAELALHAAEEEAHVELWRDFAAAVGGSRGTAPARPETARAAATWAGAAADPAEAHLVRLYAIESAQPAIAARKLEGLRAHYAIPAGGTTAYFAVHAAADHEHAALARRRLDGGTAPEEAPLLAHADAVHRAYWELLDGIERAHGRDPAAAPSPA
jgi:pyrroloquinoline-quinone synthase